MNAPPEDPYRIAKRNRSPRLLANGASAKQQIEATRHARVKMLTGPILSIPIPSTIRAGAETAVVTPRISAASAFETP